MGGRDHSYECDECGKERGGLNDVPCDCPPLEPMSEALVFALLNEDFLDCMYTLSSNLRTAAGLCAAFELGLDDCDRVYYEHACSGIDDWQEHWHPGCQRSAP